MSIDSAFQTFPRLETENLILREIWPADVKAVFDILSDDEVTRFYDDDPFTNVSQASELVEYWTTSFASNRCIRWGIVRKSGVTVSDGAIIGTCGYYGFHTWHMRASLGYELARSFWRRGIMTEALSAVIEFGFEEAGLNRIQADVMPENQASVKLLERLGFKNEGLLREYERWSSKGYVDLFAFSLLKREYKRT
ncbi:MAG: GNAT family N-acetyltransferase [Anaerolineae bacterium]|jgi:ribosomal-protein-alanine N-acetyltransferase